MTTLVLCLFGLTHRFDAVLDAYEDYLTVAPDGAPETLRVRWLAGMTYAAAGDRAAARAQLERYVDDGGPDPAIRGLVAEWRWLDAIHAADELVARGDVRGCAGYEAAGEAAWAAACYRDLGRPDLAEELAP